MTPKPYSLKSGQHLPPIEGPKLGPFEQQSAPVQILEMLSLPPGPHPEQAHSHVFKVRIEGMDYALKVFKFFNIHQARADIFPFNNYKIDAETFTYHSDPFFAECRAYGKIKELQAQRQKRSKKRTARELAVPCYGYSSLPADPFEEQLKRDYKIVDWNRQPQERERPYKDRMPLRAIVKKFVDEPRAVKAPWLMASDLKALRKGGIIQHDVFARNYMDGFLIDFSVAWTKPHWVWDALNSNTLASRIEDDLEDFDTMIEESGSKSKLRLASSAPSRNKSREVRPETIQIYSRLRPLPGRQDMQRRGQSVDGVSHTRKARRTTDRSSERRMTLASRALPDGGRRRGGV